MLCKSYPLSPFGVLHPSSCSVVSVKQMFSSMSGNSQIWTVAWGKQNKPENSCRLFLFIYFVIRVVFYFDFSPFLFLKVVKNNHVTINWRKDISGTRFIQADYGDRMVYPNIVFPARKLRMNRIIGVEEKSYLRAFRFSCVCIQKKIINKNSPLQLFLDLLSMSSKQDDASLSLPIFLYIFSLSPLFIYN